MNLKGIILKFLSRSILFNSLWFVLLLLAILPFLILSWFNHPVGVDDWDYLGGCYFQEQGFFEKQWHFYSTLVGRYGATFLLLMITERLGILGFKILPAFFILILAITIWKFVSTLFNSVLTPFYQLLISLLFLILYFASLNGVYESVYFVTYLFNGQLGIIACIWIAIVLIQLNQHKKLHLSGRLLLFTGIVFANGCYELTSIIANVMLSLSYLYFYLNPSKQEQRKKVMIFMFMSFVFAAGIFLAPGNFVRLSQYNTALNFQNSFILAAGAFGYLLVNWIGDTAWIIVLLITGLFLKIKPKMNVLSKGFWALGTTLVLVFLLLLFNFLATGISSFPERVEDLLFLVFLLGSLWSLSFLTCKDLSLIFREKTRIWHHLLIMAFILNIFFKNIKINRELEKPDQFELVILLDYFEFNNNIANAWLEIFSGHAWNYNKFMFQIYQQLSKSENSKVYIDKPAIFPKFIYDSLHDRKYQEETCMGAYFNSKITLVKWVSEKELK